jgi:phage shock protein E
MKAVITKLISEGGTIIDVRSPEEFTEGANRASVNIPLDVFAQKLSGLNPDKPYILCCASGGRSGMAASIMKSSGFKTVVNAGPWQNTLV